jgi:hypothetical protein
MQPLTRLHEEYGYRLTEHAPNFGDDSYTDDIHIGPVV